MTDRKKLLERLSTACQSLEYSVSHQSGHMYVWDKDGNCVADFYEELFSQEVQDNLDAYDMTPCGLLLRKFFGKEVDVEHGWHLDGEESWCVMDYSDNGAGNIGESYVSRLEAVVLAVESKAVGIVLKAGQTTESVV